MAKIPANNFNHSLSIGKKGERHVAKKLKKIFAAKSVKWAKKGEKGFDFILLLGGDLLLKFECKVDVGSKTSGKIFLEFLFWARPSGLGVTKSDYYCILIPHLNEIFIFCPKKMLKYLKKSKCKERQGGFRQSTTGYILPIDKLRALKFVDKHRTNTKLK